MNIRQNEPLAQHSTMRLGGTAAYACEVQTRQDVAEAVAWAEARNLPYLMIGDGSNIVWQDQGFAGLLIINKILRFEEQQEDEENYYVTIGAGENWDSVVARTVAKGMSGIEALSLIPGTAGATPVQNVGAYGQEISQTLVSIEAYDTDTKQFINIPNIECGFGYRMSRFKSGDRWRFLITAITLHLLRKDPAPPFYNSVQAYFDEHGVHAFHPATVRDAVIAIRNAKLPDPAQVANNGSFFANPVIDESRLTQLMDDFPGLPHWSAGEGQAKLSAAWLIEQAGFKDMHDPETGMATWFEQPLVLVNEHAKTTQQLLDFKQKIVTAVQTQFNIILEQEPELLP